MSAHVWRWKTEEDSSERADRAILEALSSGWGEWSGGETVACSRNQLQRLMEEGQVLVSGIALRASGGRLSAGASVEIRFPPPRPTRLVPEDRPLQILFEDEHLVVVNKPPGLTVHPSSTQLDGTLVHALLHHVKDLSGIGGELRPGIVHRIDKNTSGALVITKTDLAHRALVEEFSRHSIEREYWAFCYGSPKSPTGRIDSLIGRNPKDRKKMSSKVKEGRQAITHYRKIKEYGFGSKQPFASWLAANLETGRTHQVRVHLTDLGHSLLGDPVYGTPGSSQPKWKALPADVREAIEALPGQALHARVLGFAHPVTQAKLRFEAELPPALAALHFALEKYSG